MCYRQAKPDERERGIRRVGQLSADQQIVSFEDEGERRPLIEAHWADDRLMILRSRPILVYAKDLDKKDEHSRLYGDMILHCPWNGNDEMTEFGAMINDVEACQVRHGLGYIDLVKERLRNLLLEKM